MPSGSRCVDQDQIVIKGKWTLRARRDSLRDRASALPIQNENSKVSDRGCESIRETISFQLAGFLSFRIRGGLTEFRKCGHDAEASVVQRPYPP